MSQYKDNGTLVLQCGFPRTTMRWVVTWRQSSHSFIHSCLECNAVLKQPHFEEFYLPLNYRSPHYLDIVLDSVDAEVEVASFGVHDDEQSCPLDHHNIRTDRCVGWKRS